MTQVCVTDATILEKSSILHHGVMTKKIVFVWDLFWDPQLDCNFRHMCGSDSRTRANFRDELFLYYSEVKCIRAIINALVLCLSRVRHQLQASLIFLYSVIVSTRNAPLRRAPAEGS